MNPVAQDGWPGDAFSKMSMFFSPFSIAAFLCVGAIRAVPAIKLQKKKYIAAQKNKK